MAQLSPWAARRDSLMASEESQATDITKEVITALISLTTEFV